MELLDKILPASVNKKTLLVKAHYFFFNGGIATSLLFMSVLAKTKGITSKEVGYIFMMLPIFTVIVKVFLGAIVDKTQKPKIMMIVYGFSLIASILTMNYLPKAMRTSKEHDQTAEVICSNGSVFRNCTESKFDIAKLKVGDCAKINGNALRANDSCEVKQSPMTEVADMCSESDISCRFDWTVTSVETGKAPSWVLWTFAVAVAVYWICFTGSNGVADAACYEILGADKGIYFGYSRVFGSFGYGIVAGIAGPLNDYINSGSPYPDYSPGIFLGVVLLIMDVVVIYFIPFKYVKSNSNIVRDVRKVFSSGPRIIVFSVATCVSGFAMSLYIVFEFLYVMELGANQTILSLAIVCQVMVGEVVFFPLSKWMLKTITHKHCMTIVIAATSLRCLLYSQVTDPWLIPPVEVLHGVTFGLFYATVTSYAKILAPEGTEATMQSIVYCLWADLGMVINGLASGTLYYNYGGRKMFLWIGCFLGGICAVHFVIQAIFVYKDKGAKGNRERRWSLADAKTETAT
ncbi:Uncharacterised protein g7324 [Pycnogonum litorale]